MTDVRLSTSVTRDAARVADRQPEKIEAIIADLDHLADLEIETGATRAVAVELVEEAGLLADVLTTKATAMELADSGYSTGGAYLMAELARLSGELSASLGDDVAAMPPPAETVLTWMQTTGAEGMTADEFAALAEDPGVPPHVRHAVASIASDPVMMSNLDRAGWLLGAAGAVTPETMMLFVATQEVSRGLGAPGTFDAFDSAHNGELDDRISREDVRRLADDESADPSARALAYLMEENPFVFAMLDPGTGASSSERVDIYRSFSYDGRISFGDVVSTAVNTQAFGGRPEEAREFVMGLPSTNDYRDATGDILKISWFSDSGVRNLAAESLSAAPTLAAQVGVVGRLPESPGGVRNLAITEYYRRIGGELDRMLNPDGDGVLALDAQGSTGANWFMHGAFASSEVRPILVDNNGYGPVTAGWAARQSMADGNQLLFDALAPAAAEFIDAFPPGVESTPESIEQFFNGQTRPDGRLLFEDGDRQLRDGFALLLDSMTDTDPVTRQQTTFQSNLLIGVHEQALVDPFVDRAIDQGWDDGFRVLGDIFDSDESIATGQVDPDLGDYHFDADEPLPVRHAHPDHVIGEDLTTTLNPATLNTASINGLTYDLSGTGQGDVDLPGLKGWDDPPDHWDLEAQVVDPAEWHDEYGTVAAGPGDHPMFEEVPGSSTGVPLDGYDDLPGAAADDWKNYPDRMWTITNGFHQAHTMPSMADTLPGNGFDEADLSFLPEVAG